MEIPCRHRDLNNFWKINTRGSEKTIEHLQIRRCSSCRLRRCFEKGMKEEFIRTDEENERFRQLVEINRRRRGTLNEQTKTASRSSVHRVRYFKLINSSL